MPNRVDDSSGGYWHSFGFFSANALALHRPGRFQMPGKLRWDTWPEVTLDAALGGNDSLARQAFNHEILRHGRPRYDWLIEQVVDGLKAGERWTQKHRRLISADEVARRLNVDEDERDELKLRTIGAVDRPSAIRKKVAAERKRERDRLRAESKRRAAGSLPRAEFEAGSAAKEGARFGLSARTIQRRRKANRVIGASPPTASFKAFGKQRLHQEGEQSIASANFAPYSQAVIGASPYHIELRSIDNSIGDAPTTLTRASATRSLAEPKETIDRPERREARETPIESTRSAGIGRFTSARADDDAATRGARKALQGHLPSAGEKPSSKALAQPAGFLWAAAGMVKSGALDG